MLNLKIDLKKCAAILTAFVIAGTITGCAKKSKCDIPYEHAHKYVNSDGVITYRDSENERIWDFIWTGETTELDQDVINMTKYNYVKILDNKEYLTKLMENNKPYKLYEISFYSNSIMSSKIDTSIPRNRKEYDMIKGWKHAWTKDKDDSECTGDISDVTYKYYGYQVYTDDKGKMHVKRSELVDDIFSIVDDGYPYINLGDFCTEEYSPSYKEEEKITK